MWKLMIKMNCPIDTILDCYVLEQQLPEYENTTKMLEDFVESGKQLKEEIKVIKVMNKFNDNFSV